MSPWITKVDCFIVELSYHHLPGMPSSNYVIDSSWAGKSIHKSVWLGTYPKRHKEHAGNGGTALTIYSIHIVKSFVCAFKPLAPLSQFGLRLKAWLSHYGSCQKDFATSHVTEAFGQCHYPAKCWPLITQMSAKNGPKLSLGLTQDKREMAAFNSSQRGDVFVKTWSFVKIQQWRRAKCSMSQMWQRWNAIQACDAAVPSVSFKAFDPLFMSDRTKITPTLLKTFFLSRLPWKSSTAVVVLLKITTPLKGLLAGK